MSQTEPESSQSAATGEGAAEVEPGIELLEIERFAGIRSARLEVRSVAVFIGPEGTGKSVVAKLLWFFREFAHREAHRQVSLLAAPTDQHLHERRFNALFAPGTLGSEPFEVRYRRGGFSAEVKGSGLLPLELGWSSSEESSVPEAALPTAVRELVSRVVDPLATAGNATVRPFPAAAVSHAIDVVVARLRQVATLPDEDRTPQGRVIPRAEYLDAARALSPSLFIPAGRSIYAHARSLVLAASAAGQTFDADLANFFQLVDAALAREREANGSGDDGLGWAYRLDAGGDMWVTHEGREVPLRRASSGQQELQPLAVMLRDLARRADLYGSVFIEEPEAHLYPATQVRLVRAVAALGPSARPLCVTTHSPYVLVAFNNLAMAARVASRAPEAAAAVARVVPAEQQIAPAEFCAYRFDAGEVRSIVDAETGLIDAAELDGVSTELALELERILDAAGGVSEASE